MPTVVYGRLRTQAHACKRLDHRLSRCKRRDLRDFGPFPLAGGAVGGVGVVRGL